MMTGKSNCAQLQVFGSTKLSVIIALWCFGGLKRKNQRKSESGSMMKFLLRLMSRLFRFGLFPQIQVPSKFHALPSE